MTVADGRRGAVAHHRRPGWTVGVRVRIVASVLVLTGLAMLASDLVLLYVQRAAAVRRVDATIARDVSEFRDLAAAFSRPAAGAPAATVSSTMSAALSRQVPAPGETYLGVVDGHAALIPAGRRPMQLEHDPVVMAAITKIPPTAAVTVRRMPSAIGPLALAVVPVSRPGDPTRGEYVIAMLLAPGLQSATATFWQLCLLGSGALLLAGVAGWAVAGRLLRPLRALRDAARQISQTDLSLRIPVTGRDDISELTRTVNAMLGRLEEGMIAQRTFLQDASHELATPLTIVLGHLEVLDTADPADVRQIRDLTVEELVRMGRLVDDLNLLAHAAAPDFVRMAPVDLDAFTHGLRTHLAVLADRCWMVDEATAQTVLADRNRLTQALLQLGDNAAKHTRPGQVIGIGSEVADGTVRLWVRDTGPGVAAQDAARIFQRFARSGGESQTRGLGLGLAIVETIACAHGGTVELSANSAAGATFTLSFPYRGAPSPRQVPDSGPRASARLHPVPVAVHGAPTRE